MVTIAEENKRKRKERELSSAYKSTRKKYRQRPDVKAKLKAYRQRPDVKAKQAVRDKQHRLEVKMDVFRHYSKKLTNSDIPCCNCCGFNDFLISLEIDHIENRNKIGYKKDGEGHTMYSKLKREGYPSGYQVLCANCN